MRIGAGSQDNTHCADALAPRSKTSGDAASPDGVPAAPERSGALARLGVRQSSSTSGASRANADLKGKRPQGPPAAAAPAAKRLRPAGALLSVTPPKREPLGEPENTSAPTVEQPSKTLAPRTKGSRQKASADMVYRILVERLRGASTSVIAGAVSVPDGTVGTWINAKRWQSGELQSKLSNMQDYAQHRVAIGALLKTLGVTSEELPPPSANPRGQVSAHLLKAALELMLAKQGEHLIGRGRTQGMVSAVAGSLGVERRTLGAWLNADGSPAKPLDAFARLPDYEPVRGDLQALFVRLGHVDVADNLPAPGDSATHKMTTALLVDVLRQIAADRTGSSAAIGGALGVQRSLVRVYVSMEDGSLRAADLVRRMPDYGEHREALAAALAALGHEHQARDLPLPFVDAEQLLKALRNDMPRFVDAVKAMQADPTLSPREAAGQADLPPEALTAVTGGGGTLRRRSEVFETLSRLGDQLVPGIDEALAWLRAAVRGKAPIAAAPREMARFELPARGSIPAKVFIVRPSTGDPGPKAKNRLEKIYANNADLVRSPRSYETERPRQMLRWLSTVLKDRFPDAREIQCYFHAGTGQIVVASNTNEANTELAKFFAGGGAQALAEGTTAPSGIREARHADKLHGALVGTAGPGVRKGKGLQEQVRAAIAAGRFHVPLATFSERGATVSLHAERRILHYLRESCGESLDRRLLAGTMRPCGSCADELGLDDAERRGPFWLSRPAQAFTDTPRIIERNIAKRIGTYVTQTREGRVTTDYDTDSDSDLGGEPARTARGRR